MSGLEADAIQELFGGVGPAVVLTGAAASEDRFKLEASGKRVLHLATHGFFLQGDCRSGDAQGRGIGGLAVQPASQSRSGAPMGANPLLLSGLVLAGANRAGDPSSEGEDGILTAEELASLDLSGAELVALSACDTGLGTLQTGEGVMGLRRALEIAGARTVLMSLWPVPDYEAMQWMTAFYQARLGGSRVVDASQRASVSALARLRERKLPTHPYLWAGFVAAGDWR